MFTKISWGDYCIAIGVLVLAWYIFLGVFYYRKELKQIVSGKGNGKFHVLGGAKAELTCFETNSDDVSKSSSTTSFSESFSISEDMEELSSILINAIKESVERNLSKDEFRNYLRLILDDFQFAKESTLRVTINKLMVSECEKHPQMILTYAEVDGLWDETI